MLAHVLYLALWSPDPFLQKWIEGSFTFFIALVLCNIIRARVVAAAIGDERRANTRSDPGPDHAGSRKHPGRRRAPAPLSLLSFAHMSAPVQLPIAPEGPSRSS